MKRQAPKEMHFQKTIDQIIYKAEAKFASSLIKISKQYINDFTMDLHKELQRLSAQIRSENLRNLRKDLMAAVTPSQETNQKLSPNQIMMDLAIEIAHTYWRMK